MKSHMRLAAATAAAVTAVIVLAGCAGGGGGGGGDVVEGGTFTYSTTNDPGALDPQESDLNVAIQLGRFAYDSLVGLNPDGGIVSQLATDWKVDGTTVTLTIGDGITCSDGSAFTADTAAANIEWVGDPENQSPYLGTYLAPIASATAEGSVVTIELAAPAPFVLEGLANVPMVCDSGMADRDALDSATFGTGPYVLTEVAPNDHYTYTINKDYKWGPDGQTTDQAGLPDSIVARVIPNETTAANLVLSGEINAATVLGPDAQRLEGAGLFSQEAEALSGEQWYNHSASHVTSDPAVRMALTQALDLQEIGNVLTSGTGKPAQRLSIVPPSACTYDSVSGNVPETDIAGAEAALDAAGWVKGSDGIRAKDGVRLTLTFLYPSSLAAGGTSAAELAVQQWQKIGIDIAATQNDSTTLNAAISDTGAWDVAWVPLNTSNPDQLVAFLSGTPAPEGSNFSDIQNADYEAGVATAMGMLGTEGCDTWKDAEAALFQAADLIPFSNSVVKMFGKGAEFTVVDNILPLSIRMTGN